MKKQKKAYILYQYNQIKNDLIYIKEYQNIKEIEKDFKLKKRSAYNYITRDIEKLNNNLLQCKYTIIEERI